MGNNFMVNYILNYLNESSFFHILSRALFSTLFQWILITEPILLKDIALIVCESINGQADKIEMNKICIKFSQF